MPELLRCTDQVIANLLEVFSATASLRRSSYRRRDLEPKTISNVEPPSLWMILASSAAPINDLVSL